MTEQVPGDDKPWNKMSAAEKKASGRARAKTEMHSGLIGIVLLLLTLGGCAPASESPAESPATETTATTERPAPSAEPKPVNPAVAFEKDVRDALGNGNRDDVERVGPVSFVDGVASVRYAINDNVSEGFIRKSARIDAVDIIKQAKKLPGLTQLQIIGTFPLQNNLGESAEREVVEGTYSAEIVQRINVKTVNRDLIFELADVESIVHPVFRED